MSQPNDFEKLKSENPFKPLDLNLASILKKDISRQHPNNWSVVLPSRAEAILAEWESQLLSLYKQFGLSPEDSSSFRKYSEVFTMAAAADNPAAIKMAIDNTEIPKNPIILTSLGREAVQIFRKLFPNSSITFFDIDVKNILFQVDAILESNSNCVVADIEHPKILAALIDQYNPDFFYISNIPAFVRDVNKTKAMARVLADKKIRIICGSLLVGNEGTVAFIEELVHSGYQVTRHGPSSNSFPEIFIATKNK